MAKSELKFKGEITKALSNAMFEVELETGIKIIASISGRMRMNYIKIMPGDGVEVEMSPYDLTKGRISSRLKVGTASLNDTIKPKKRK